MCKAPPSTCKSVESADFVSTSIYLASFFVEDSPAAGRRDGTVTPFLDAAPSSARHVASIHDRADEVTQQASSGADQSSIHLDRGNGSRSCRADQSSVAAVLRNTSYGQ